jgi:protein-S-isoprenylcysteine O-methyltransferase Ste14
MARTVVLMYGVAAYGAFFAVFVYLIGFVGNLVVPKSIDSGEPGPWGEALLVNTLLVALFGIQHSVMARPAFKSLWTKVIPHSIERSTYVLLASLVLALLFWQWRPIPATVWDVRNSPGAGLTTALFFVGWATVLYSSFLIDHFDLFGLRQVYLRFRNRPYTHRPFAVRSLYRLVRHPLMLGFLVAVWSTPAMTVGHLAFALLMTGYIWIGVRYEERDLARHLGAPYESYRAQTPMFVPSLGWQKAPQSLEPRGGA